MCLPRTSSLSNHQYKIEAYNTCMFIFKANFVCQCYVTLPNVGSGGMSRQDQGCCIGRKALNRIVAERLRALFLNHSIISPLCLVWVRAPLWPHVRQAKFCLRMCQVVFLGVLPFSPYLMIGPSHMS